MFLRNQPGGCGSKQNLLKGGIGSISVQTNWGSQAAPVLQHG
jgi:hypothetical protein